jgi:DNA-directed RNA polymerase subunit RPC12/RpoP
MGGQGSGRHSKAHGSSVYQCPECGFRNVIDHCKRCNKKISGECTIPYPPSPWQGDDFYVMGEERDEDGKLHFILCETIKNKHELLAEGRYGHKNCQGCGKDWRSDAPNELKCPACKAVVAKPQPDGPRPLDSDTGKPMFWRECSVGLEYSWAKGPGGAYVCGNCRLLTPKQRIARNKAAIKRVSKVG